MSQFIVDLRDEPGLPVGALAARLRAALGQAKVVHLREVAAARADWRTFYDDLTEQTGQCLALDEDFHRGNVRTGHKWIEVRYDPAVPNGTAYRYGKNAQPLHTDESYLRDPADVMLMFCLVQAPAGGETTFVDADALWHHLRTQNPTLAQRLLNRPVRFAKADDWRVAPIVAETAAGVRVNWNFHCLDPAESTEAHALAGEFRAFLWEQVEGSALETALPLAPGEAVIWWDDQVLHGRRAFRALAPNDRYLLKTGFKFSADVRPHQALV